MKYPSPLEFLEAFGLEPVEEDPSTAYVRYIKHSNNSAQTLDISFSAVQSSFQATLKCDDVEVMTVSSENVRLIEIRQEASWSSLHVMFDVTNGSSEAVITLEPHLHCHWWTLRD